METPVRYPINTRVLKRLFNGIQVSTERFHKGSPCWEWRLGRDKDGYGRSAFMRKSIPAHRLFYGLFVAIIPKHLVTDHLCRNRICVNPVHLEPVTVRENTLRGEGLAAQNAKKTHCPKGHPLERANLVKWVVGRRCKICNDEFYRINRHKYMPPEKNRQRVKEWEQMMKALPDSDPKKIAWRERQRERCARYRLKQRLQSA